MVIEYDNLEEFRDPVTYDLECDGFDADWPFMRAWAEEVGGPLLDLACGTGRMSIRMALEGHEVTGVDVVGEMVERGREKAAARGADIEWVVADGRDFHLGRRFRGIYMLMNAFQFFLGREDQEAMLGCVREHLEPEGRFLFETRNAVPRNLFETRFAEGKRYLTEDGAELVVTEEQRYDPLTQIQHYTCPYVWVWPDGRRRERIRRTALRYVFPQEMEALLFHNGFEIASCYGSWEGEEMSAESRSMIVVCRRLD